MEAFFTGVLQVVALIIFGLILFVAATWPTLLALLCLRGVAECKARLKARGIEDNNQLLYYGFYACCAVLIGLNIYMWVYHPPFTLSFG